MKSHLRLVDSHAPAVARRDYPFTVRTERGEVRLVLRAWTEREFDALLERGRAPEAAWALDQGAWVEVVPA